MSGKRLIVLGCLFLHSALVKLLSNCFVMTVDQLLQRILPLDTSDRLIYVSDCLVDASSHRITYGRLLDMANRLIFAKMRSSLLQRVGLRRRVNLVDRPQILSPDFVYNVGTV